MSREIAHNTSEPLIRPVVLAGGAGTRLWPLSRQHFPKQFLPLAGDLSLLQQALMRLRGFPGLAPWVICNEAHRFVAAEQIRQIQAGTASILLEPVARSTAPAIALAALHALAQGNDSVLLVLPSDHLVRDVDAFHQSVLRARDLAAQGFLVTFGVAPNRAETGYGYMERGAAVGGGWHVAHFAEKPDADRAARYLVSGSHVWNSGMLMFTAGAYIRALSVCSPDMLAACRRAAEHLTQDIDFLRVDANAYAQCPAGSVDRVILEHTDNAVMVELDAGWADLGTWAALDRELPADAQGNHLKGDVLAAEVTDTLVRAESRLVAAAGVHDLVIVETADAVLVASKDAQHLVAGIVSQLDRLGRCELLDQRKVYRPWGTYDLIGRGPRYQVKKIVVAPGASLSLQMHHHRAEHWVVVTGTAKVTNGEKTYLLTENQSTYIPVGQIHQLENPGVIPLELIEVQSGAYLGEDDIVRLADGH